MQNPGDFCEVSDKKFCERPLFFCAALLSTVASSAWRVPAMLERRVLGRRGGPKRSGKCPNYAQTYQKVRFSVKVHESARNPGNFCEVRDNKFCEGSVFPSSAQHSSRPSHLQRGESRRCFSTGPGQRGPGNVPITLKRTEGYLSGVSSIRPILFHPYFFRPPKND